MRDGKVELVMRYGYEEACLGVDLLIQVCPRFHDVDTELANELVNELDKFFKQRGYCRNGSCWEKWIEEVPLSLIDFYLEEEKMVLDEIMPPEAQD
jgi:hypothetical protein